MMYSLCNKWWPSAIRQELQVLLNNKKCTHTEVEQLGRIANKTSRLKLKCWSRKIVKLMVDEAHQGTAKKTKS